MKPKLVGILLFLCLVAPLLVTFTYLHHQKVAVRKELKYRMIEGISLDQLVLLKFTFGESQTRLHWHHAGEFEYHGQMYDIVHKEIKGDTIHYWCWKDDKETELNRQLDDLVAKVLGNNPQRKDRQDKTVDFLKKLYFNYPLNFTVSMNELVVDHPDFSGNFPVVYNAPPVPPPRLG